MKKILKFIISGTPKGFDCFPSNDLSGFLNLQYKTNFSDEYRYEIRKVDDKTVYTIAQYGLDNASREGGFIAISFVISENFYCTKPFELYEFLKKVLICLEFPFKIEKVKNKEDNEIIIKSYRVDNFQKINDDLSNFISGQEINFSNDFKGAIRQLPKSLSTNYGTSKVKSINIINGTTDEIVNTAFLEFGAINFTNKEVQIFEELDTKIISEFYILIDDHKTGLRKKIKDLRSEYNIINDKHETIKLLRESKNLFSNKIPPVLALISISNNKIQTNLEVVRNFKNKLNSFKNIKPESLKPYLDNLIHFETELKKESEKLETKKVNLLLLQKVSSDDLKPEPPNKPDNPEKDEGRKQKSNFNFYVVLAFAIIGSIGISLYFLYPKNEEGEVQVDNKPDIDASSDKYEIQKNIDFGLINSKNKENFELMNENLSLIKSNDGSFIDKKDRLFKKGIEKKKESIENRLDSMISKYPEFNSDIELKKVDSIYDEAKSEIERLDRESEKSKKKKKKVSVKTTESENNTKERKAF